MNADPSTLGYEPDPHEVDAIVDDILEDLDDPMHRYVAATAGQVFHQVVAEKLAAVRAGIAADFNVTDEEDGSRLSYAQIAELLGMSRGRAQQLVEKGRVAAEPQTSTREPSTR